MSFRKNSGLSHHNGWRACRWANGHHSAARTSWSEFANDPALSTPVAMLKGIWSAMATGFAIDTGYEGLDSLFSRGGMASMLGTVWLIISAMAFGGVLEYTGLLDRLLQPVLLRAKSDRSLVAATGLTSIGMNIVAGDQYMAIVLPGRMFREPYAG